MEPVRSISKLREIIRNDYNLCDYGLYRYSTAELRELLYIIQHEIHNQLSRSPLFNTVGCGIVAPVYNKEDMERIIRLEEALIQELRLRGENVTKRKFTKNSI